ncbi:protein SSUH2 homolog [Carcharodon carcharias]|uniref:protein SSUH2 homolog n=1 Tax=Carcharodon carcharias TaxID=13397 RepID=UPI001B7EB656|nr:protein SSUH2 homolog [Carcharodon carcharias]
MSIEGPTAPPVSMLDSVAGYESIAIGGEERYLPPPVYPVTIAEGGQSQPVQQWSIASIDEDAARQALIKFASDHVTYSRRPAEEMVFKDLKPFDLYRYRLESFTESRSPEWKGEPYHNQIIDNCGFGPPPPPWEVAVDIPKMFEKSRKKIQVPHTASVKECHNCMAMGKVPCNKCFQTGWVKCWVCLGKGNRLGNDRCDYCMGNGKMRKSIHALEKTQEPSSLVKQIFGRHQVCYVHTALDMAVRSATNARAKGQGQLFFYIQLTVKWENNKFEQVVEQQCGFPTQLLSKVNGQQLFSDQQVQVYPVMNFPEARIKQASQQGIQEHWTQFGKTSRIIQQRHSIELIPVTEVHFQWKGKDHTYFVCGTENKVHAPEYPGKTCTIM